MNNWKEYPHLFYGFEVQTGRKQRLSIIGVTLDKKSLVVQTSESIHKYAIDNCTLIARRIEDMSEGEKGKMNGFRYTEDRTVAFSKHFLYLLSIGVYPFDQAHFDLSDDDPAKVIDIKTIGP